MKINQTIIQDINKTKKKIPEIRNVLKGFQHLTNKIILHVHVPHMALQAYFGNLCLTCFMFQTQQDLLRLVANVLV